IRSELFFFFFSSRRRHTRSKRDWSSDVCSSDLGPTRQTPQDPLCTRSQRRNSNHPAQSRLRGLPPLGPVLEAEAAPIGTPLPREIGRASCRERVCIWAAP